MRTKIVEIPQHHFPPCDIYKGGDGSIYLPGYSLEYGEVWVKLMPEGQRVQVFSDRPLSGVRKLLRGTEIQITI